MITADELVAQKEAGRVPVETTLRRVRESFGLSLLDVANATGITKGYLSQLETGQVTRPSVQIAVRLAHFYGWRVEQLFAEFLDDDIPIPPGGNANLSGSMNYGQDEGI